MIELVLNTPAGAAVASRVDGRLMHAPHLIDLEVAQTLRRLVSARVINVTRATDALVDFQSLRIQRHGHFHLLDRIWELRSNATVYDACYVALAEYLNLPLLTGDAGIASARWHGAKVELI